MNKLGTKHIKIATIICLLLLFAVLLLNLAINRRHFVNTYLDYDAAAELMLGKTMADNGEWIVSGHWYYSTELRVLHNQLVFAPLFRITQNVLAVQYVGALILDAFLAGCVVACFKLLGMRLWQGALAAALIITPYSPVIFNNLHSACYYTFFIGNTFLFIGLFGRLCHTNKGWKRSFLLAVLALFSFALGLCGMRYALMVFLPLLLVQGWHYIAAYDGSYMQNESASGAFVAVKPNAGRLLLYSVAGFLFFSAGLVVYSKVLIRIFPTADLTGSLLFSSPQGMVGSVRSFIAVLFTILAPTFEHGIVNFQGLLQLLRLVFILSAFASAIYLFIKRKSYAKPERFYIEMAWSVFLVNFAVLVVTKDLYVEAADAISDRYVILAVLPLMALPAVLLQKSAVGMLKRVSLAVLATIVLFANYINLDYISTNTVQTDAYRNESFVPVVDFLVDNGYSFGGIQGLHSGVVNVLSNNRLQCANMVVQGNGFALREWSQSTDMEQVKESGATPFFILTVEQYSGEPVKKLFSGMPVVWEDENYIVVEITDRSLFLW